MKIAVVLILVLAFVCYAALAEEADDQSLNDAIEGVEDSLVERDERAASKPMRCGGRCRCGCTGKYCRCKCTSYGCICYSTSKKGKGSCYAYIPFRQHYCSAKYRGYHCQCYNSYKVKCSSP